MNHIPEIYADVAAAANRIIEQTFQGGGGTFDFKGNLLNPPFYVVGGAGEKRLLLGVNNPDTKLRLALYMQAQPRKGFDADKGLIGTWINNGILYVDRVTIHQTYIDAVTQGFHRDQIAIWDGENGVEIPLKVV